MFVFCKQSGPIKTLEMKFTVPTLMYSPCIPLYNIRRTFPRGFLNGKFIFTPSYNWYKDEKSKKYVFD